MSRFERTIERDGCTRDEALARINAQVPIEEKRNLAEYIVDNTGTLEATETQVTEIYRKLTGASGTGAKNAE